jgi:tRNA uracil 4-sulfurtransferase
MEPEVVILKPAELILKSKGVRKQFEQRLLFNVKACLKQNEIEFDQIIRGQGRYFIYTPEPEEAISKVKDIFGIANLCAAAQVGANIDTINKSIYDLAKDLGINSKTTFGIRATILSNSMSSRDVEKAVGAFIQEKTKAKVNLTKPNFWLRVEVIDKKAFVYSDIIEGLSGLPLGTSGKAIALMSENQQDILAAWLIMKRGCEILPIHIRSNEKELNQFQKNIKKLERFAWGSRVKPVSVKDKKDLKKWVEQTKAKAYVFGDTEVKLRKEDLPVFTPLVGLDKKELKKLEKTVF